MSTTYIVAGQMDQAAQVLRDRNLGREGTVPLLDAAPVRGVRLAPGDRVLYAGPPPDGAPRRASDAYGRASAAVRIALLNGHLAVDDYGVITKETP